ncbi:MAG: hypothetical protein ABI666_12910 [Ferruginibacter sp.]
MKRIFIILVFLYSCSPKKYNHAAESCLDTNFNKLIISQPDDIYIKIPSQWTVIDSSIYGIEKNLINTKTVYSKDSSKSIFFIVQDFKPRLILNNDTNEIKKYQDAEAKKITNNHDSIVNINGYAVNGWYTVVKKSYIKGSQFKFLGQIISVQGSKQLHILVRSLDSSFDNGNAELACILSSYSIIKQ